MLRRFSTNFAIFSVILDGVVILACLWGAVQIRPFLVGRMFRVIEGPPELPVALYILFPVVWVVMMALFSVYDGQKNLRIVDEFTSLTLSSLFTVIMLAGVLYLSYRDVSRALFLLFALSAYALIIFWRIPARLLYWLRNRSASWCSGPVLSAAMCRPAWICTGISMSSSSASSMMTRKSGRTIRACLAA